MATGLDHILFLDKAGKVNAMGDDTFGQCGTGGEGRTATAPFFEARIRRPKLIKMPAEKKVSKVICGFRHSLAITTDGQIYGWGYNNQL